MENSRPGIGCVLVPVVFDLAFEPLSLRERGWFEPLSHLWERGWGEGLLLLPLLLFLRLLFRFWVPFAVAAESAGKHPQGDGHGCPSFFATTGCRVEKFPLTERTRSAKRGGRAGWVCFLLVTFLCTSKEK